MVMQLDKIALAAALWIQPVMLHGAPDVSIRDKEWYKCGAILRGDNDAVGNDTVMQKLYAGTLKQYKSDDEFLLYLTALAYVESKFNTNAHSKASARGVFQMTYPAMVDAATECRIDQLDNMDDLENIRVGSTYASCYLRKLLRDADGDWMQALIIYNGGYAQLTKFLKEHNMVSETANYVVKVLSAVNRCKADQTREPTPVQVYFKNERK